MGAHKLNVLDAAGRGEMRRPGGTEGRGGDVPLCDLGHLRRARSPARTHNAKSISTIVHVGPFMAGGSEMEWKEGGDVPWIVVGRLAHLGLHLADIKHDVLGLQIAAQGAPVVVSDHTRARIK